MTIRSRSDRISKCPFCRSEYSVADLRRLFDHDEDEVDHMTHTMTHTTTVCLPVDHMSHMTHNHSIINESSNDDSSDESNQMFTPYL